MSHRSEEEIKLITTAIHSLISLSKTDHEIHGKELMYLLSVSRSYGISDETIHQLIQNPQPINELPVEEVNRMTILYYLLFLMRADGEIKTEEEALVVHFGFLLGFNELLVREMIEAMANHLHNALPPDELITIIKKYKN